MFNNDENQDKNFSWPDSYGKDTSADKDGYTDNSGKDYSQNSYDNYTWQSKDDTPKSVWSTDGQGNSFASEKPQEEYKPAYVDNTYQNNMGNAFAGLNNFADNSQQNNANNQPVIPSYPVQNNGTQGYNGYAQGGQNEYAQPGYNQQVIDIDEHEPLPEITQEEFKKRQQQELLAQKEQERRQAFEQKQQARQQAIEQKAQQKQAKEQAKLDKLAEKEEARLLAQQQKEQAKQQALDKKEQERQAKEQAKADKLAKKDEAKQAKEQAKFELQNKKEEAKQAKEQAKLDKKQAKEQAKLDKKLEKQNKKLKNNQDEQPVEQGFADMQEYEEQNRRQTTEERDMLGGDFVGNPQFSQTQTGYNQPQQPSVYSVADGNTTERNIPTYVSNDVETVLVTLPDKEHMTRRQRKIAKKASRFDEMDLRNYPMTVGKWIGTFIVMALPLINLFACILWFFGVGNKSRTALIRSLVVIQLLIVILIGILLGVGYYFLAQKAQQETGAETFNEVLIYGVNKACDALAGVIGEDKINPIRDKIVGMLGGSTESSATTTAKTVFTE